ncbi:hypothetical protein ACFL04_01550 [Patescibacteria group bacterium]
MINQKAYIHIVAVIVIAVISLAVVSAMVWFKLEVDNDTNVNTNTPVATNNTILNTNRTTENTNTAIVTNTSLINTNSAANTTNWLAYTNDEYNYTIKYPLGWAKNVQPTFTQVYPTDAGTESSPELAPTVTMQFVDTMVTTDVSDTRTETINGLDVTRQLELGLTELDAVYFPTVDGFIKLAWATVYVEDYPELAQVLTTFQFFKDPTADWQTYNSSDGSLNFKYPTEGWFIGSESQINDVFSWILTNWDTTQAAGRGGLDDGMIKADFAIYNNSDNNTVENVISCDSSNPEYETVLSCDYAIINDKQFKKLITDSQVEGSSRAIVIGTIVNDKRYTISGFVPTGDQQLSGLEMLDDIMSTIIIY